MIRVLLCEKCAPNYTLHPEDLANGYLERRVSGNAFKPTIRCDHCDEDLNGKLAVAVTHWQMARESEPGFWEREFFPPFPHRPPV